MSHYEITGKESREPFGSFNLDEGKMTNIKGERLKEFIEAFPPKVRTGLSKDNAFLEFEREPATNDELLSILKSILIEEAFTFSESSLKEKSDDDLASLSHEEYINVITPQPFLKSSRNFIVQALLKLQQYTDFKNLAPQEAEGVYHSIIDVMTQQDGWSLGQVTRKLQAKFPQLSEWEAERIARTETTAIANKARELDFQDSQPPETLYYWGGPDDDRTSDVCREIKERLKGQGLPLGALKALVNEVSVKYGMKPRDWTPHPQCRHTVRIWYGDL